MTQTTTIDDTTKARIDRVAVQMSSMLAIAHLVETSDFRALLLDLQLLEQQGIKLSEHVVAQRFALDRFDIEAVRILARASSKLLDNADLQLASVLPEP